MTDILTKTNTIILTKANVISTELQQIEKLFTAELKDTPYHCSILTHCYPAQIVAWTKDNNKDKPLGIVRFKLDNSHHKSEMPVLYCSKLSVNEVDNIQLILANILCKDIETLDQFAVELNPGEYIRTSR